MSAVAVETCTCETIGAAPGVRLCPEHFRYWNGDKRLVSISRVIRDTWPIPKSFEAAPPDVLEHARERGVRVDRYAAEFVKTGGVRIEAGEWQEVVDRVQMFAAWWHPLISNWHDAEIQVIFHDDEIAGTADFVVSPGAIWDLKCVSALDPTYYLQLGAYAEMCRRERGGASVYSVGFIHITKDRVKFIEADMEQCIEDWLTLRKMWQLVRKVA